jgi:Na+-driven multidrug efflux pump
LFPPSPLLFFIYYFRKGRKKEKKIKKRKKRKKKGEKKKKRCKWGVDGVINFSLFLLWFAVLLFFKMTCANPENDL